VLANGVLASTLAYLSDISTAKTLSVFCRSSKVAFYALKFAKPIRELGNQIKRRIQIKGPYIGIHHSLEKDAQVRRGWLTVLMLHNCCMVTKEDLMPL
nr:GDP-fucose protein O-fucosyltransferase [Tanacetum cinerariifolium]